MKYYLVLLLFPWLLLIFAAEPADRLNDRSYCFFGSFTFQNASRECYAVEGLYTWKSCCCDLLGESWGPRCADCPLVTSDEFTKLCNANADAHIVINHLLPSILSAPPVLDEPPNDCSIDVPGTSSMATNSQAQAAFKTCCCEKGLERVKWQSKYFSCPAYGLGTYHLLCGSAIDVEEDEESFDSIQSDSSQVVVIGPCFKNVNQVKEDYWACSEPLPGEFSHTECCCQQDTKAWGDECQPCSRRYPEGIHSAICRPNAGRFPNSKHDGEPAPQELAETSSKTSPGKTEVSSALETSIVSQETPSVPTDAHLGFNRDNYKVDILQVEAECYISKKINSTGLYCLDVLQTNMTLSDCCCLIGQGWGNPCQMCPDTDSKLFSELCMSASGFGAAHRDPVRTEDQFMYPMPPFMSSESESLSVKPPPVVLAPDTESLSTLVGFDLCYELVYFVNDTAVCGLVMVYLLTYSQCCCDYPGIGRGWGQDCIPCPLTNTNEFDDMCGFSVSFDHSTYISYRPEIPIPDYDNSMLYGCYGPMMQTNTSYDEQGHCTNNMLAAHSSEIDCCCLLNGESWGRDCTPCSPIGTDDFALLCDEDYREAEKLVPLEVPLYERCYALYNGSNGGYCEGVLYNVVTWEQCCCTMAYGKAWGSSCFPCPPVGSEAYKLMCNVPLISIDYDPSELCRRDNCSPGRCEVVNGNTEVCLCPIGYKQSRKGLACQDVDECMLRQGLCEPGACFNTLGSYYCFCPDGFAHFQGEEHCKDFNECASIGDQCHPGSCVNLEGSFECRCPIGFYYNRDQVICDDLNECSVIEMLCYPGICLNTDGSFKCVCPFNYEYDIRRQLCIPKSKFTSIAIMIPSILERPNVLEPAENPESQPDKAIGKVSGISKGVTTDGDCNEMDLMPNLADICKPFVRVNVTLEFIVKHNVTNDNEELWLRKLMALHFKTEINVMVVEEIEGKPHELTHPWEVKKFSAFVSEMCTRLHIVHKSFETIVDRIKNNSKSQVYFSLTVIKASFSEYIDETSLETNCIVSKHNYSETYFIESGHSSFVYISASNILYVPSQVEFEKVHRFSESGNSCQETSLYVCSNKENLEHCPPLVLNSTISLTTVSTTTDDEGGDTPANQSMLHPRGRPDVCSSLKRDNILNYATPSFFPQYSDHMQVIISCVGILLSLVALTITFIVRCLFRSLRTLLGKILMNLIGALFIGQLGVLLQGQGVAYPPLCTTIAAVMHYVWLAAFFWMNAMALDFFFTFGSKVKLRKRHSKRKILQAYMFYGWGAPLPIIILCLVIHFGRFHNLRFRYGSKLACWIYDEKSTLLAFGLPLMIILLFNILLFICAVIGLRLTKKANKIADAQNSRLKRFRTDLLVYVKMSTLMGFTWIFGFISAFTELEIFLYTFIILNSLQGVFIFMAFTCNKHVRKEVKRCLNRKLQNAGRDQRKSSAGRFNSSEVTRQSEEPVKGTVNKLTHL